MGEFTVSGETWRNKLQGRLPECEIQQKGPQKNMFTHTCMGMTGSYTICWHVCGDQLQGGVVARTSLLQPIRKHGCTLGNGQPHLSPAHSSCPLIVSLHTTPRASAHTPQPSLHTSHFSSYLEFHLTPKISAHTSPHTSTHPSNLTSLRKPRLTPHTSPKTSSQTSPHNSLPHTSTPTSHLTPQTSPLRIAFKKEITKYLCAGKQTCASQRR